MKISEAEKRSHKMAWRENAKVNILRATRFFLGSSNGDKGVEVTATADEINAGNDYSVQAAKVTVGAGIGDSRVQTSVVRTGDIIKTTIAIDLTGLASKTTNKDIIGLAAGGVAYIAQITTAVNGVIHKAVLNCAEVPTTGDDDIDIYQASVGTGEYDDDASGLTDAAVLMTAGGALAIGTANPFTALPTADYYLYLTTGDTTAGTYDAGKIIIELYGTVA
jgi:hypothetical protein